jgi:hypothetical protein
LGHPLLHSFKNLPSSLARHTNSFPDFSELHSRETETINAFVSTEVCVGSHELLYAVISTLVKSVCLFPVEFKCLIREKTLRTRWTEVGLNMFNSFSRSSFNLFNLADKHRFVVMTSRHLYLLKGALRRTPFPSSFGDRRLN